MESPYTRACLALRDGPKLHVGCNLHPAVTAALPSPAVSGPPLPRLKGKQMYPGGKNIPETVDNLSVLCRYLGDDPILGGSKTTVLVLQMMSFQGQR